MDQERSDEDQEIAPILYANLSELTVIAVEVEILCFKFAAVLDLAVPREMDLVYLHFYVPPLIPLSDNASNPKTI